MFEPTKKMTALHSVIFISKAHHAELESKFGVLGLHRTAHMLLSYLNRKGEIGSQKELARRFKVSEAAIVHSLDKLEEDGYIRRVPVENDRRKNLIEMTEKGADIIEKSKQIFDAVDEETFAGVTEDELDTLNCILNKISSNLSKQDNDPSEEENR